MMKWPNNKNFAFTIFDDTDNSFIKNISPIYDLLKKHNILTTKSIWIYPPKDDFTGYCLEDNIYLDFVKELKNNGFEIALHNVGSGKFERQEIIDGVKKIKTILGNYPKIQANHAKNPDNIYWGDKRFIKPFNSIYKVFSKAGHFFGEDRFSNFFWGDIVKQNIKYIRNFTFNGVNTLKYDPMMPYIVPSKSKFSNYWFSSSDGHTVEEFNNLIKKDNIDRLEQEKGACIAYTHFASGFVDKTGAINTEFKKKIEYLSNKNAWFVPVSTLLDYLLEQRDSKFTPNNAYLFKLNLKWFLDRIIKKIKYHR